MTAGEKDKREKANAPNMAPGSAEFPSLFDPAPTRADAAPIPPKDHRHGHRERLRARFMDGGPSAVADYELLELVLFRAIPRRDVKPLAKRLIDRFGDFAGVVAAEPHRLHEVEGLGDAAITELKVVEAAAQKLARERAATAPLISSWDALTIYCRTTMGRRGEEQFRVLFLDSKNKLIADEVLGEGTVDQAPVYPRKVVKRALELNATALILAHNHPSGDPTPSQADIEVTRKVCQAAAAVGLTVHDHVIIGADGAESLRSLGLM